MDWRADQMLSELWDIIDLIGSIEEIEISRIRDACDAKGISCERFVEKWQEACDEAEIIITQAEAQMHVIN